MHAGRRRWLIAGTVAFLALSMAPAAAKRLSVADALKPEMAGPLPAHVIWAPDGNSIFFLDPASAGKAGDLLVLDAGTRERRVALDQATFRQAYAALASLSGEKAEAASFRSFSLSPKGRYLLIPKPEGLFLWDLAEKKLTFPLKDPEAADFGMSPDEGKLAFVSKGSLWLMDLKTGARTCAGRGSEPKITCGSPDWLYAEELDLSEGYWWSPDGSKLAYLRFDETWVPTYPIVDETEAHPAPENQFYPCPGDPNPRVTLHLYDLASGSSSPVPGADSSDGYLPRVAWLPDGRALAFELLDRPQQKIELFLSELPAKKARKVLEETDEAWVNVLDGPRFLKDGKRFLWLSERSGFAHVYLFGSGGNLEAQLTKGPWAVDEILGTDEAKGLVYFSGSVGSPTECRLYAVPLKGGEPADLSGSPGWHKIELSPTGRSYLDSHSRAGDPGALTLASTETGTSTVIAEGLSPEIREYGFGTPEIVTLKARDGTTLYASILKPADFDPAKRYPAVVEVYGGPHMQMVQDRWAGRWAPIAHLFAQAGFVCFSVDGRGSWRRGKAFEGALRSRLGKSELEDQLSGLDYLKSLPYVDGSRVGIWGWSYGGFMTLYALTHAPAGSYRCGAAVAAVADWTLYDSCYTERYLGFPKTNPDGYRDSSPANSAQALGGALFLAHGLVDDNVHFANPSRMTRALYAARKPYEMAFYPKMSHGIGAPSERSDLFTRILDFFKRNLAP